MRLAFALALGVLLVPRACFAYTAEEYLALFATKAHGWYVKDPARIARIAIAAERAELKLAKRFPRRGHLGPALATVALKESGLWPDTHDGSRRGKAGEVCLTQIHPTNSNWKAWAPSFESLAGTSIDSTELCFLVAGETLVRSLNYCLKRRYYTNWRQAMFTMYHYGSRCWLSPHGYPRAKYMTAIASTSWAATPEQQELLNAAILANGPQGAPVESKPD